MGHPLIGGMEINELAKNICGCPIYFREVIEYE